MRKNKPRRLLAWLPKIRGSTVSHWIQGRWVDRRKETGNPSWRVTATADTNAAAWGQSVGTKVWVAISAGAWVVCPTILGRHGCELPLRTSGRG